MEYKFRSLFNREKEYVIDTENCLEKYDSFALSIGKLDNNNKSFGEDNIDCVLKYGKKGVAEGYSLDLDKNNFDGYHMFVETYKRKGCLKMGEAIELAKNKPAVIDDYVGIDDADENLRLAFDAYLKDSGIMDVLFKCFLGGILYWKNKNF